MANIIMDIGAFEDLCEVFNDYELYDLFEGGLDNYRFSCYLVEAAVNNHTVEGLIEAVIIRISKELNMDFVDDELRDTITVLCKTNEMLSIVNEIVYILLRMGERVDSRTQSRVRVSGSKLIIEV